MDERRQYTRTLFAATATLSFNDKTYRTNILDLSINGALVSEPEALSLTLGQKIGLSFLLPESDIVLNMDTVLVHHKGQQLGLESQHIDLDSISHLKRIIELNIGDAELLHRELAQLLHLD